MAGGRHRMDDSAVVEPLDPPRSVRSRLDAQFPALYYCSPQSIQLSRCCIAMLEAPMRKVEGKLTRAAGLH